MTLKLIKNACVVTMDPTLGDIDGGDLLLDGGKIAQVGYAAGEQVEEGASLVELEEKAQ